MFVNLPSDMIHELVKYLEISDIGSFAGACKFLAETIKPAKYTTEKDLRRRKRLVQLRKYNPITRYLDCIYLSYSTLFVTCPYVTYEIIINNLGIPWDLSYITSNPNITLNQLVHIISLYKKDMNNYSCFSFSVDSAITIAELRVVYPKSRIYGCDGTTITELKRCGVISADVFMKYGNLTYQDIVNNPQIQWDYERIATNPNVSASELFKHITSDLTCCQFGKYEIKKYCADRNTRDSFEKCYLHKYRLQTHNVVPCTMSKAIREHCPTYLSRSKYFSIDTIVNNPDVPWCWFTISKRKDIPLSYKRANPQCEWWYSYHNYILIGCIPQLMIDEMEKLYDNKTLTVHDMNRIISKITHEQITWNWKKVFSIIPFNQIVKELNPQQFAREIKQILSTAGKNKISLRDAYNFRNLLNWDHIFTNMKYDDSYSL